MALVSVEGVLKKKIKPVHWRQRKRIRLRHYDYRQSGAYFVTGCAYAKKCHFATIRGDKVRLKPIGEIVADAMVEIPKIRSGVQLDRSVIMPNHFHGIILFECYQPNPLGTLLGQMKRAVTVEARRRGFLRPVFQARFHDHVIRDETELDRIREYIETNPLCWSHDIHNPGCIRVSEFDRWLDELSKNRS